MRRFSLSKVIDKSMDGRRLIEDETEKLIMKQYLICCERVRIFLNRWWIFALLILAVSHVVQTVIAILEYLRNP